MKLLKLLFVYVIWCFHNRRSAVAGSWKRNDFPDRALAHCYGEPSIKSGDAAMWRNAIRKRFQKMAEALLDIFAAMAECFKNAG